MKQTVTKKGAGETFDSTLLAGHVPYTNLDGQRHEGRVGMNP